MIGDRAGEGDESAAFLQLDKFGQRGIDGLFLGFELAELDGLADEGAVEIEGRDDGAPPNGDMGSLQNARGEGKRRFMRMAYVGWGGKGAGIFDFRFLIWSGEMGVRP